MVLPKPSAHPAVPSRSFRSSRSSRPSSSHVLCGWRGLTASLQRALQNRLRALCPVRARWSVAWQVIALQAVALLTGTGAAAQSPPPGALLRVATAFDPQTMDPHAVALLYHSRVAFQVHESLIGRGADFKLEPALARTWRMVTPTLWRLELRAGVTFHDGTPFGADDAVFSLQRALVPPSQRSFQLKGVTAVRKAGPLAIEIELEAPDAVLPEKLPLVAMMSKAWSERHGVTKAQDFNARQETHANRQANGTGPYRLERYEPDVRTVLRRHAGWWGWSDPRSGNVDQVHLVTIKSDATRLAALVSGEVDLVLDPPYQDTARLRADPRITLLQTEDLGQQYLGFDVARSELEHSDVKGRNPFQDLRVRQAVRHAVDVPLIVAKVLRGQAVPTATMLSPRVDGAPPDTDTRRLYDPAKARALLTQAGYGNGFAVTLDCVNVAWREAVCQAVSAMLTQVGIRTQLRSSPSNVFFPKLTQASMSFYEIGWSASPDAWNSLNGLFRTHDRSGLGTFNGGRYANARLDTLIDAIRVEPDLTRRRAMVSTALKLVADDLPLVPLYRRTLTWAMSRKVVVVQWPNDLLELRWARIAR